MNKQRKIKFRAWDKNRKRMFFGSPVFKYSGTHNGVFDYLVEYITGSHLSKEALDGAYNFEIMQYTGLKDKNGKEIYEGDLVKDKDGKTYEVYYEPYYIYPFGEIFPDKKSEVVNEIDCEVIGNIYENPELLK